MKIGSHKQVFLLSVQFFLFGRVLSQTKDTIYFNDRWEICEKSFATYYRIGTAMQLDSFVFYSGPVKDYYLNGTLQMEGVYTNNGYKDGSFSFYYPDGKLLAQGSYTKNGMYGPWKYYYPSGTFKAKIYYSGTENSFIVLDYFDSAGKQLTKDGTGKFEIYVNDEHGSEQFKLTGSFLEGKRNGSWNYFGITDNSKEYLAIKENYNKGDFKRGETGLHYVYNKQPFVISNAFHFKFYTTETFVTDELSFKLSRPNDANEIINSVDSVYGNTEDTSKVFEKTEVIASFPGGEREWRKYLEKNLDPSIPLEKGAPSGIYTVVVQFIVDKDGTISKIKPFTNHGYGMEKEVMRIISKGPNWVPAIQNGRNVRSYRKQPVTFIVDR